jgi:hypothetical protein
MSTRNQYCGSTPIPNIYVAANIKNNQKNMLTSQEIMRENYKLRLMKLMYDFNLEGQSAGGGKYVFPSYEQSEKKQPAHKEYNTFSETYKSYDVKY